MRGKASHESIINQSYQSFRERTVYILSFEFHHPVKMPWYRRRGRKKNLENALQSIIPSIARGARNRGMEIWNIKISHFTACIQLVRFQSLTKQLFNSVSLPL